MSVASTEGRIVFSSYRWKWSVADRRFSELCSSCDHTALGSDCLCGSSSWAVHNDTVLVLGFSKRTAIDPCRMLAVPFLPRPLLIATTLIAVVLGLIVWTAN